MIVLVLASVGLLGLTFGVWASYLNIRDVRSGKMNSRLDLALSCLVGVVLRGITVLYAADIGYPLNGGRAAGIPFLCAWFDAEGSDYVGPSTFPAMILNALFWTLFPQVLLRLARLKRTS